HERERVRVAGRVHALRVQPWAGQPTLECTITDGTGRLTVVFLGRRSIAGIEPGARIVVDGMVGTRAGQRVILNPDYQLLIAPESQPPPKKAAKH
ncbi:MAG TPA: OB-fold nucleic acid binding domain-containing protein, partial [Acidimicrobiia bacterium]|nr:OB-fold nucleic acid binding domain-containing protein [Acidimicrobiia bacterium]